MHTFQRRTQRARRTRKFPVFACERGNVAFMRPSGCIILHILSPQKHGVLLCRAASRTADVLRWQRVGRARFLFQGVISPQTASVYQVPLGVSLEKKKKKKKDAVRKSAPGFVFFTASPLEV